MRCFLGIHDYHLSHLNYSFNPDWEYDNVIGGISDIEVCSRCGKEQFATWDELSLLGGLENTVHTDDDAETVLKQYFEMAVAGKTATMKLKETVEFRRKCYPGKWA
jgi:hypothetical protein